MSLFNILTIQEAIEDFKERLRGKAFWSGMVDSQFVEHLAIWVGQIMRRDQLIAERYHQENWINTAVNDDSIVAHAADRLYVPRKRVPSSGTVRITSNRTSSKTLQAGTPLVSEGQRPYMLSEAVIIQAGNFADAPIEQASFTSVSGDISEEKPYHEFVLDTIDSEKVARIKLYIDEGNGFVEWTPTPRFFNGTRFSKVFAERMNIFRQIVIQFGDGIVGKIPAQGSSWRVDVWLTEGVSSLAADQPMDLIGDDVDSELSLATKTDISGGVDRESIQEIKVAAQYAPAHNDQVVWQNDYSYYIRRGPGGVAGLNWLNVWGEKQQEAEAGSPSVTYINKVFFSAHSSTRTQQEVETEILLRLEAADRFHLAPIAVAPVFVPYTLTMDGEITKGLDAAEVIITIKAALNEVYGKDALYDYELPEGGRPAKVKIRDLNRIIENLNLLVDFDIQLNGQSSPGALAEMVYLDAEASTFNVVVA